MSLNFSEQFLCISYKLFLFNNSLHLLAHFLFREGRKKCPIDNEDLDESQVGLFVIFLPNLMDINAESLFINLYTFLYKSL